VTSKNYYVYGVIKIMRFKYIKYKRVTYARNID